MTEIQINPDDFTLKDPTQSKGKASTGDNGFDSLLHDNDVSSKRITEKSVGNNAILKNTVKQQVNVESDASKKLVAELLNTSPTKGTQASLTTTTPAPTSPVVPPTAPIQPNAPTTPPPVAPTLNPVAQEAQQRLQLQQQQQQLAALNAQRQQQYEANQANYQQQLAAWNMSQQQQAADTAKDDGNVHITKEQLEKLVKLAQETKPTGKESLTGDIELSRTEAPAYGDATDKGAIDVSDVDLRKPESKVLTIDEFNAVSRKALELNGITDYSVQQEWMPMLVDVAQRESSMNLAIGNDWDINAHGPIQVDGYPQYSSRGLIQTVPGTFAANHIPGTSTNIYDPVANVAAGVNYMMGQYGLGKDGAGVADFHQAHGVNGVGY